MTLRLVLLLIALPCLSGCATAVYSPACPAPVEYDRGFQARLADEVEALPPGAALETAMLDYARLRARLRACRDR